MEDLTFFERFTRVINIIFSSPFFIALLVIIALTVFLLVFNVRAKKKWMKILVGVIYIAIAVFIFVKYWDSAFSLSDALIDKIFTALYFPNYISYVCMLIISVLLVIIALVNRKLTKFAKIGNILSFLTIAFLFVLILDTVTKYGINIYDNKAVYSSDTLLVLIQTSMGIFAIWCLVLLIDLMASFILKRLKKKDEKVVVNDNVIVNNDNALNATVDVKDVTDVSNNNLVNVGSDNNIMSEQNNSGTDIINNLEDNIVDANINYNNNIVINEVSNTDVNNSVNTNVDNDLNNNINTSNDKVNKEDDKDKDLEKTIAEFTLLTDESFNKYYKEKEEEDKYDKYRKIIEQDDKFN